MDVACVSAQLDDSVLEVLKEMVVRHGSVSSHPPVQIMELQERPGAMLVRWAKVGLDTGETRGLWAKVGLDIAETRGLWAKVELDIGETRGLWAKVELDIGERPEVSGPRWS